MSVALMGAVWKLKLETNEKIVLLRFADFANDDGENAHPSRVRLATECGMSSKSIQRTVRELEKMGVLLLAVPHDHGKHRPATYKVQIERAVKLTTQDYESEWTKRSKRAVKLTPINTPVSITPDKNPSGAEPADSPLLSKPPDSETPSSATPPSGLTNEKPTRMPKVRRSTGGGHDDAEDVEIEAGTGQGAKDFVPGVFLTIWKTRFGMYPPKFYLAQLKKAVSEFGQERVVRGWTRYVNETEGKFNPSAQKFVNTILDWIPGTVDNSRITPDDKKY